jgi:hypothetical protein
MHSCIADAWVTHKQSERLGYSFLMGSFGLSFFAAADRFGLDIISKLPKHPGAVALFILNLIGCIVLFAQKDIPGMSSHVTSSLFVYIIFILLTILSSNVHS